jgi:ATP-dependent Clp protease ATP-binding subunit ClpX
LKRIFITSTNILFILSGAFVGLEQIIARRSNKGVRIHAKFYTPARNLLTSQIRMQSIGFNAVLAEPIAAPGSEPLENSDARAEETAMSNKDRLTGLTSHDLVEYGFIPE